MIPTSLSAWADALDSAERLGADEDRPEGRRYIVLSDTLARRLANVLRAAHPLVQPTIDVGGDPE